MVKKSNQCDSELKEVNKEVNQVEDKLEKKRKELNDLEANLKDENFKDFVAHPVHKESSKDKGESE